MRSRRRPESDSDVTLWDARITGEFDCALSLALSEAVATKSFTFHYQPIVELHSGVVRGLEALVRWNDVELGSVSPEVFVPIAEAMDIVVGLDEFGFETNAHATAGWASAAPGRFVSVNASCVSIGSDSFRRRVLDAVERDPGIASRVVVELTETAPPEDLTAFRKAVESLQRAGIAIGLDDFGTRYSSLDLLRCVDVAHVKLDRSFVRELGRSHRAESIVSHLLDMAHSLETTVVAEGVERREQVEWLLAHGCRLGQGFGYSRPLPWTDVVGMSACPFDETVMSD